MIDAATPAIELAGYESLIKKRLLIILLLLLTVFIAFVGDVLCGPYPLKLEQFIQSLTHPESLAGLIRIVIWQVRLPAALMAVLVGGALSLAGAEMQTILNNPLASPFTLGVSSAAAFGAALAIALGISIPYVPSNWTISGNAFIFALGSVLLLQSLARLRGTGAETLVLIGIAMVFSFNALVALVQFFASQESLQQLVFWSMGSLSRSHWDNLAILALVFCAVLPFSWAAAWPLTALRLGEDRARSFGIDVSRLRFFSLLRVSLLAATSVAFVGTIGFIGLVGPHIARLLVGEDHRFFLPASLLTGAFVMSASSMLSKVIVPGTLIPVGIITSLIGVPFFVVLIFSQRTRA